MIGVYDFCGHYEWTFAWLEAQGGAALLEAYWDEAIHQDSQSHASALIQEKGLEGMTEYWGHTLAEEQAGYTSSVVKDTFRLDMTDCPSKGFLIRNGLHQHRDYCDHCIGWIGPMMDKAGYTVAHEHNHCGQCWWEFKKKCETTSEDASEAIGSDDRGMAETDIRNADIWQETSDKIHSFTRK
jgi:hypothetical protein